MLRPIFQIVHLVKWTSNLSNWRFGWLRHPTCQIDKLDVHLIKWMASPSKVSKWFIPVHSILINTYHREQIINTLIFDFYVRKKIIEKNVDIICRKNASYRKTNVIGHNRNQRPRKHLQKNLKQKKFIKKKISTLPLLCLIFLNFIKIKK
jgi:hypothetical protein